MTGSSPSSAKKRNRWLVAAAAFLALFGPVLYAFGPEGAGRPTEYIPVGIVLPALFTGLGLPVLVWYGSQYLVYVALVFFAFKLVDGTVRRRRVAGSPVQKGVIR